MLKLRIIPLIKTRLHIPFNGSRFGSNSEEFFQPVKQAKPDSLVTQWLRKS